MIALCLPKFDEVRFTHPREPSVSYEFVTHPLKSKIQLYLAITSFDFLLIVQYASRSQQHRYVLFFSIY